jgi:multidrug efflux pump subunit AcrA (membrane-fusion protein)
VKSIFHRSRSNSQAEDLVGATHARRWRRVAFYGVLVLAIAALVGFGLRSIYQSTSASAGIARTVTVQRGIVQESVTASGNISPAYSVNENFTAGGTVTAVDVAVGDQVKTGQVLATLDPSTARAGLEIALANLQTAETTLQQAEQGGSASQLAQNKSSLVSGQAQLSSDKQQLISDQSTLATAKAQLATDRKLGCPAGSSSSSSSGSSSSGSSSNGASTSGSSSTGSSSSDAATSAGSGSDPATAPTVVTSSAASVTTTTADLEGSVDPDGAQTTYFFQYGATTLYGSQTAATTIDASETTAAVSAQVSNLAPAASYVFRVVASNAKGTSYGTPQYLITGTSSCSTDQTTVTDDTQAVQNERQTILVQQANLAATAASQTINTATIAQDQAAVTEDQETVTSDEKALSGTVLTASIDGTVTAVSGTVGETVSAGSSSSASSSGSSGSSASGSSSSSSSSSSGFVTIDNLKNLEVVAGFAEADATKIALGQPATITLAALPSTEVAGVVTAVSPTSVVVDNVVTYDETISLRDPPATVLDGMTADVSVVVETATNVLEVPSAAVTTTGLASTVTVLKNGKQVTTAVTVGLVGNSTTQILSGVTAGEKLVEPTATISSSSSTTGATGATSRLGGGGAFVGGGGGGFP